MTTTHLTLAIAFLAGLTTFFASCLLPLVPVYLAYLSGFSLTHHHLSTQRWHIFRSSLFFVFGFITTFILLGEMLYSLSHLVSFSRTWLDRVGGLIFIIFGLHLSGMFRLSFFHRDLHLHFNHWFRRHHYLHAFLVGVTFSLAWSPCIGPILATILLWASRQETAWLGFQLLFAFSLGLGLPFLLVGLAFETVFPLFKKSAVFTRFFQLGSGILILLAGLLLLSGQLQQLTFWLLRFLPVNRFTP